MWREVFRLFGCSKTLLAAAAVQIVAWTGQVCVGHWLIEKNQPGMATGLTAASEVLSPLLIWYDVLWCLGTRVQLKKQVEHKIAGASVR